MKTSKRELMQREVRNHRNFMQDRGDSLVGYLAFYGRLGARAEQAETIYYADAAMLEKLEAQLAAMPNR